MIEKIISKYTNLSIRNSKTKFLYNETCVDGHVFIKDEKRIIITEEIFQYLLEGNKIKANFGAAKGVFWIESL